MGLEVINDPNKPDVIELKDIGQVYPTSESEVVVIKGLNLLIEREPQADGSKYGKIICLLGPSGCGKSTILRYISGLQIPTGGTVLLDEEPIEEDESVGMVFQKYSSLEWLTVLENVALGFKLKGVGKEEREKKARDIIKMVGLEGHEDKFAMPPSLSGGQLQRVAIARSLLSSPNVLLMDEPFGALDIKTRLQMQDMLIDIWEKLHPTIILVTHDIAEAVYLADEIHILGYAPSTIVHKVMVDLPIAGRTASIKRDPKFLKYVQHIEDYMMNMKKN